MEASFFIFQDRQSIFIHERQVINISNLVTLLFKVYLEFSELKISGLFTGL